VCTRSYAAENEKSPRKLILRAFADIFGLKFEPAFFLVNTFIWKNAGFAKWWLSRRFLLCYFV